MPDLLIRDLDERVLARLKKAAEANGRSLQAEIRDVLQQACARDLAPNRRISAMWLRRLAGGMYSDSAASIREDRER